MAENLQPDAVPEELFGQRSPRVLGLALLIGFALMAGFAVLDHSRREKLEQIEERSAVGDNDYFFTPAQYDSNTPMLEFNGITLYATGTEPIKLRDGSMIRVGRDAKNKYSIYESPDRKEGSKNGANYYFVKIDTGWFRELSPERMPE